eukprot:Gregarina_sp_Pseudo_9__656@NODE_1416_length_1619_cov_28_606962_g1314_i0_p1_GENE_NODE_1416_length_1619_cov_28_606962_g1314_i0NODE_1416_length_1619_cov_28_606962_g1314_i0_p1_ORF_typecomplete_len400_score141_26zfRING_2/PF13639_6/2_3e14zfANAPC11/PF12861_7/4_8e07zfrbx1/PF12678_7/1e06zfC3HC4_3/PF13920_6/2_4e02zfC3HC4_3/PF13920_6/7_2e07zfC3HC4_2/PF13923_6/1_1e06zfC3HC4/PF00097_25/1_1e05zfRING_5/PF14634_6/2e05zfRING_11/PF17123_5/2_9e03zfRING_11/PF17123_5/8_4e05Ubox/PF04564_15/0_0015Zn_ribbon_17/PF17120_
MSSADALGIVIEEGQTEAAPAHPARSTYRSAFVLRCLDVVVNLALLTAQQVQFAPTWEQSCDYPIKIWATVWISSSSVRALIMAFSGWRLMSGRSMLKSLAVLQFVFEVFGFAWFLYGINSLFVNRPGGGWCNVYSKRWALAGWIFQAICFFLPCALVCLCVPCLLCCLRVPWIRHRLLPLLFTAGPPSTNQTPTPEDILAQLKPTTFREAVAAKALDFDLPETASPAAQDESVARSLLTSTLPGPFGAVAQMMVRLNSQAETAANPARLASNALPLRDAVSSDVPFSVPHPEPDPRHPLVKSVPHLQSRLTPPHIELTEENRETETPLPVLTCPICVTEFAADDLILQLPCDPRRHVYHVSCIQEWLKKSQHCPMCRQNIVELIHNKDDATREDAAPV